MTAVPTPPLPAGPAYRPAVDVSHLPETAFGTRTTLWWGNTLLLFIETTMFALLAATYFYLRQNFHEWPPVQPNTQPPIYHPLPDLWASTAVLAVLVAACVPMAMAHVAALRLKANLVRAGMLLAVVAGVAATVLRFYEFGTLKFKWDENAYGSITWTILGTHLLHLLTVTLEIGVVGSYVFTHKLDPKKALDVTLTAIYWYWVAGMWAIFYLIVYWSPRWQ
jgi:heme/copper-type cytochrome/quinol oxidase subunit 3